MTWTESGLDVDREEAALRLAESWACSAGVGLCRELKLEQPPMAANEVLQRTIARLESVLRPPNAGDGVHYPYIPLPYDSFIENLSVVGPGNGRSFLDVGCGIGTKLVMANKMGWKVSGIEIHEPYMEKATLIAPFAELERIDANLYDGYGDFDLVYLYNPMIEVRRSALLARHIVSLMRPGAFLFAAAYLIEIPGTTRIQGTDIWQINE